MTLWNFFLRRSRNHILKAVLDKNKFRNTPFKHDWNSMVQQFDLRMWYLESGTSDKQGLTKLWEIENLHRELNYLSSQIFLRNLAIFFVLFNGFYYMYDVPKMTDWADINEPKHQMLVYGDLEESTNEGDD